MHEKRFGKKEWLVLVLFGLIGQIAWSVENMYFNLFVFETVAPSLNTVTLMVQLSGIVATLATLVAGTLSDKVGNRRSFISWGYAIWGVTVALFGFLSPELTQSLLGCGLGKAVSITLVAVVVADCVMTLFDSTANDACFNAWVTDNTESSFRGKVEGVLSILPLLAMLIVAGGFGIIVEMVGYPAVFLGLGAVISVCGICGIFTLKDSPSLRRSGGFKDILYGFRPSVVKGNAPLYVTLCLVLVYGIACQIFMPYLIIYMKTYLGFSVIEYSIVFGAAIILGAAVNLYLTRLSDKKNKQTMLYFASAIFAAGLLGMYFAKGVGKTVCLITFGLGGFVMITGYILISALCGSLVRDYTPEGEVGKLQGVRMVFSVLIPMIAGPMIGNGINAARNIPLADMGSADVMTTRYIPAPEIFLAGSLCALLMFALIPVLKRISKKTTKKF
ncbi:MAG: MFS transporter [Clostridia bacterium]|nr:MFS transporter [Clostridia bacterium]